MKQEVLDCLTWLACFDALSYVWDKEEDATERKEVLDDFYASLRKFIDWDNLTFKDAHELHLSPWDDETMPGLRLIPIWLYPIIPDNLELTCIDGTKITKAQGIDDDVRFGCIAYGIYPKPDKE